MKTYTDTAEFFESLMGTKNAAGEIKDILNYLSNNKVRNILDFGCGTGLHTTILDKLNYKVTGIDISDDMLNIARSKNSNINYICTDILKWNTNDKYDACISMWNVIAYVPRHQLKDVFRKINRLLNDNGLFIFDCFNGIAVINLKPQETFKTTKIDNLVIERKGVPEVNYMNQTFIMKYIYNIKRNGEAINVKLEKHDMVFYTPTEIQSILEDTGFSLMKIDNVKDGSHATQDDWDIRYIALKVNNV